MVTGRVVPGEMRGMARLFYIRKELLKVAQEARPTLIAVEGYAMGFGGSRNPGRVFDIGELGGTVKLALWDQGHPLLLVSPSTMKSAMAGTGKADKTQVADGIASRFGYRVKNNDEADALGLMLVGEIKLGLLDARLEQKRLQSIHACETVPGRLQLIANY